MPPRLAYWLTAAVFAALVAAKFSPATGFTSLLRFGESLAAQRHPALAPLQITTVPASSGYDGQFYAQLALDPTLRDPALATALDAPAYRSRRIAAPATAHVLGLGSPWLTLNIFALLNVACWAAFAVLLRREIAELGAAHGFARWFACVFSLGVLDSVRQSLVDLPALLALLLALRAHRRCSTAGASAWSALGHLTKETNLLASAALWAWPRPNRRQIAWFALSACPLVIWLAYVAFRFPGGESGLGNFTWPILGAVQQLRTAGTALAAGNLDSRHLFAAVAIPGLFLQFWTLLRLRGPSDPWWRIGIAYGALLLVLGPWVWSGYWAACRAVLPLTVAFNLLLPANRAFWPLFVFCNLPLLHAVWRFL
jgi:hypothetical protein